MGPKTPRRRAFWPGSHHDGDEVAAVEGQRPVHVQQVMLEAEEAVQVVWVVAHLLGDGLDPPPAGQGLHKEQLGGPLLVTGAHLAQLDREGQKEQRPWGKGPPDIVQWGRGLQQGMARRRAWAILRNWQSPRP